MAKSRNRKKKKKWSGNRSRLTGMKLEASIIKTKARSFDVFKCFSIESWENFGTLNTIIVLKTYGTDRFCIGVFLIDPACLGIKDASYRYGLDLDEAMDIVKEFYIGHDEDYIEIEYDLANELVWGAHNYAEDLGFKPHKDFTLAKYFLSPKKELTNNHKLDFGVNGKPFYHSGPYDNVERIMSKLIKKFGPDGFKYLVNLTPDSYDSYFAEEEEDENTNSDFAEDAEVEYLD